MVSTPITTTIGAFSLKGKNAIVTGGSKGIGLGIARAFAEQGANVGIMCRNTKPAEEVVAEFNEKYEGKFACYALDVTDMAMCKSAVAAFIEDFGNIDILVNNAGMGVVGAFLDMDEDMTDWFKCIDTDLNGAARMSYVCGKYMRDAGKGGRVINITSNSGAIINHPTFHAYHASKAGLNHFTRDLAVEWGQYGITVNAIAPGYTWTDMCAGLPDEVYNELVGKMPSGRFGQTIELGALAVYLASDAAAVVTGTIVTADGGYSLAI